MKQVFTYVLIFFFGILQLSVGQIVPIPESVVLDSWEISDAEFVPGDTMTIRYLLCNADTSPQDIGLGASIRLSTFSDEEMTDPDGDVLVTTEPGCNWHERTFLLPDTVKPGSYSLAVAIWDGQPGNGTLLEGTGWIENVFVVIQPPPTPIHYRMVIENTWSEATHPGRFPVDAHFSWFGGVTHNDQISFWNIGTIASPGIKQMAENGRTDILGLEVGTAIDAGTAGEWFNYPWWFCPDETTNVNCGDTTVEFAVTKDFPLVTFVSMLGPSPDWFVGVSGLSLRDEDGRWLKELVIDLKPLDAGTRDANRFEQYGPLTTPPGPVSEITPQSGELIGSDSLGTMTITMISPIRERIELEPGWNLISSRRKLVSLSNPDLADLWGWNASEQRFHLLESGTPIEPLQGYWIVSETKTMLELIEAD